MKQFINIFGYAFAFEDDSWCTLSPEQRIQMKLNNQILDCVFSSKYGCDIYVVYDHFEQSKDKLEDFYNLCKTNILKSNFKILNETKHISYANENKREKIEAYKVYLQRPDGEKSVSYHMRLTGQTPNGYLYGCLTTNVSEEYDTNDACVVEAISNWTYYSTKRKNINIGMIGSLYDIGDGLWRRGDKVLAGKNLIPVDFMLNDEIISEAQFVNYCKTITNLTYIYDKAKERFIAEYGQEVWNSVKINSLYFDSYQGDCGFLGEWSEDEENGLAIKFIFSENDVNFEIDTQDILI